jgi:hypothetical protein
MLTAACATQPPSGSQGLTKLEAQLRCPRAPAPLTDDVAPPNFADGESWVAWSDALLGWGAEEARRRHDLARWISTNCGGDHG